MPLKTILTLLLITTTSHAYEVEIKEHCTEDYTVNKDGTFPDTVCVSTPDDWRDK